MQDVADRNQQDMNRIKIELYLFSWYLRFRYQRAQKYIKQLNNNKNTKYGNICKK